MAKNGCGLKIEDCSVAMQIAFRRLELAGYTAVICSEYQLKIGDLNYWPTQGTIRRDGEPTFPQKGIDPFIDLLNADHQIEVYDLNSSALEETNLPVVMPEPAPPPRFSASSLVPKSDMVPAGRKFSPQPDTKRQTLDPLWKVAFPADLDPFR